MNPRLASRMCLTGAVLLTLLAMMVLPSCKRMLDITEPLSSRSVVERNSGQSSTALEAQIESDRDDEGLEPSDAAAKITGPTVIAQSGAYRVTRDFSVKSGDGIVIRASHVWLSLGGHTLMGPGNKSGRAIVIDHTDHVLVSRGTVQTFGVGVALLGASRSAVKSVKVVGGDEFADPPSVPPQIGVLIVDSHDNRISRNRLKDVNLGIFVRGGGSYENKIRRNSVSAGQHGLLGICYNPAMDEGPAGPSKDEVSENVLDRVGKGIQASTGSHDNEFESNTIKYFVVAWEDRNGTNQFRRNRTAQLTP